LNYISLKDELDLTVEDILQLDKIKIIRLQKQLKAKAVLEGQSNLGELSELLNDLERIEIREAHVFIERHLWLKYIVLNNAGEITNSSFQSTFDPRKASPEALVFINQFLKETVTPALSYLLNDKKYYKILKITEQQHLFSEEVRQKFISFFKNKLQLALAHLKNSSMQDPPQKIAFLKELNYTLAMNVFIEPLVLDIINVNTEIISHYKLGKEWGVNNNPSWDYASQVMICFGRLTPANPELQSMFRQNSQVSKSERNQLLNNNYATRSSDSNFRDTRSKKKNNEGSSVWTVIRVIVILFAVIRVLMALTGSSSNSQKQNHIPRTYVNTTTYEDFVKTAKEKHQARIDKIALDDNNTDEALNKELDKLEKSGLSQNEVIISTNREKSKAIPGNNDRDYQDSHIRFLYSLKNKVLRGDREGDNLSLAEARSIMLNPYPKTFDPIPSPSNGDSFIKVVNRTGKRLIIFKLKNGRDQAKMISASSQEKLTFTNGDTIIFYSGSNFQINNFSTFRKFQDISHLYVLKDINEKSRIMVRPFKDNDDENAGYRFKRKESLLLNKLTLDQLENIDLLYTQYYKENYSPK